MYEFRIVTIEENGKTTIEEIYKIDGKEVDKKEMIDKLTNTNKEKWIKCTLIEAMDRLDVFTPVKVYFNVGDYYLNVIDYDIGDVGCKEKIYEDWEKFVKDMESGKFNNATYYYRDEE